MLRLECKSKLSPEAIVKELKGTFGKGGLGLALKEESPGCLTFEGGGGYISVSFWEEGNRTWLDLVTQEWDYQVKQFVSKVR